jgi:hypothetical protein
MFTRLFNPDFLKEVDRYFLLNYPRLWLSNIHRLLYRETLFNALIIIYFMILPSERGSLVFIGVIPLAIVFFHLPRSLLLLASNARYELEKQYGISEYLHGIREILIYTFCLILIISPSLSLTLALRYKVSDFATEADIVADIRNFSRDSDNEGRLPQLLYKYYGFTVNDENVTQFLAELASINLQEIRFIVYQENLLSLYIVIVSCLISIASWLMFLSSYDIFSDVDSVAIFFIANLILAIVVFPCVSLSRPFGYIATSFNLTILMIYGFLSICKIDQSDWHLLLAGISVISAPIIIMGWLFSLLSLFFFAADITVPIVYLLPIVSLSYLPIVPYLKRKLLIITALPKEK